MGILLYEILEHAFYFVKIEINEIPKLPTSSPRMVFPSGIADLALQAWSPLGSRTRSGSKPVPFLPQIRSPIHSSLPNTNLSIWGTSYPMRSEW